MDNTPQVDLLACRYCHSSSFCPTCNGHSYVWLYFRDRSGRERVWCVDCLGTGVCQECAPATTHLLERGRDSMGTDSPPTQGQ